MKRCKQCQGEYVSGRTVITIPFAYREYEREVTAWLCPACGTDATIVSNKEFERAELEVARRLAYNGEVTAEAFKFMRHALSLSGEELGRLIDKDAQSISRWERGAVELPRSAWLALAAMVIDRVEGRAELVRRAAEAADHPQQDPARVLL